MRRMLQLLLVLGIVFGLTAQTQFTVKGKVTDSETKQPLPSANVMLIGTKMGSAVDLDGRFSIGNVPAGTYTVKATMLGYVTLQKPIVVRADVEIGLALVPSSVQVGEVIIEVNRAKDRETPVAFSDVGSKSINKQIHSQDAPLLVKNIPGVYSYSTDGVGNGESKMFVRGFDQNRVQVLINGIPTNDPESNSVYWSNWGAVSSAAASIQVQRGAGSSLYGAGSFGGSFNVVTQEVASKFGAEAHGSVGDPELNVYGFSLQSGLLADNLVGGAVNYEWKTGRGNREGSYYQGANYYAAAAIYPDDKSSAKLVIHGGPQEHGYSYNAPISYFKMYGYNANPAYYLPVGVLKQMVGGKTLEDSLHLTGDSRLLRDSKYLTLSHNFYHKPQLELHLTRDIDENNSVRGTVFYSVGRGGGSSVTGTSYLTSAAFGADTVGNAAGTSAYKNLLFDNGVIKDNAAAAKFIAGRFLAGAAQRISYSLHRQYGVIASWETKVLDNLKLTLGGEYRDWYADHPGHYTNLYGKQYIQAQAYGYRKANGKTSTFTRRTYQGDMDFGGTDKVDVDYYNPFMDYTLSTDGGTYRSQYRNYVGQTTQGTVFGQVNYTLDQLTFIASIQYVNYKYHITENMPSESAVADTVTGAWGSVRKEGPDGAGNFYMASYSGSGASDTINGWYKFKLVNATRSRGFFQPKIGVNYNVDKEINVFANYSHVERLVDLSVYYNYGNPNPNAGDELSNQFEAGVGYKDESMSTRLNGYIMTWENKTASITDVSKAGLPGYDRNGNRYELVGESRNMGIELESSFKLDALLGRKGFTFNLSAATMNNKWTKVLDQVKTDPNTGLRRAFDTGALNRVGQVDTLFFDQLEGKVNASTPFTTLVYGLTYEADAWFVGVSATSALDFYAMDGGTYIATDGYFDNSAQPKFMVTKYTNKLPASTVIDFQAGLNLVVNPLRVRVTGQVMNVFDTEFLVSANRSGVLPGITRSYRLNVGVGI